MELFIYTNISAMEFVYYLSLMLLCILVLFLLLLKARLWCRIHSNCPYLYKWNITHKIAQSNAEIRRIYPTSLHTRALSHSMCSVWHIIFKRLTCKIWSWWWCLYKHVCVCVSVWYVKVCRLVRDVSFIFHDKSKISWLYLLIEWQYLTVWLHVIFFVTLSWISCINQYMEIINSICHKEIKFFFVVSNLI